MTQAITLIEVVLTQRTQESEDGVVHRKGRANRCGHAPDVRESVVMELGEVSSELDLCPYCEWPLGAEDILED